MEKTSCYLSTQKWNDNYFKIDELFEARFKPLGYEIDDRNRIRATEGAKTVEFAHLWDILTSDDE